MSAEPLKIWTLSDGKAGHFNQSKAIVMALGKSFPVEATIVPCKLRMGLFQHPLRFLLNMTGGNLPRVWFHLFHVAGAFPKDKPDLIVSAGGNTCCANVWLSRMMGCRNLFCGNPRGLNDRLFAGLITSFREFEGKPGYIVSPTPVPIDPRALALEGAALRQRLNIPDARLWSMLVGGNGAGYHYDERDWQNLARAMEELASVHGIRWVVTTSRRSGELAENVLSGRLPSGTVAASSYVHSKQEQQVRYAEVLGVAERHFCTEDSHMMISEAIATGKPVHTLQPSKFRTDPTNLHFLRIYEQDGLISRHGIASFGKENFAGKSSIRRTSPPLMEILAEKLARWWRDVNSRATAK